LLLYFRFFINVTLIIFGSARAREIEKDLQQNASGLGVAVWRIDAQSETLQRKFPIIVVGTVPRSVLQWVCGQRVMRIVRKNNIVTAGRPLLHRIHLRCIQIFLWLFLLKFRLFNFE
jgi:hypothetical protein